MGESVKTGSARGARLSSVANATRLVKAFSDTEYEIGISNLARRLGLAKSTVHRIASTLVEAGFLARNPRAAHTGSGSSCSSSACGCGAR
jgi:predicted transcriptional regulator